MHPAVPSHHDDDDGGSARRTSPRHRARDRRGAAAASGNLDRRRSSLQPDAHALHDARRLSLSRPVPAALVGVPQRALAPSRAGRRKSMTARRAFLFLFATLTAAANGGRMGVKLAVLAVASVLS